MTKEKGKKAGITHMRGKITILGQVDTVAAHLAYNVLPQHNHLLSAVNEAARVGGEASRADCLAQWFCHTLGQRRSEEGEPKREFSTVLMLPEMASEAELEGMFKIHCWWHWKILEVNKIG